MPRRAQLLGIAGRALRAYVAHFPIWGGKHLLVRSFGRLTAMLGVELPGMTRFGATIRCNLRDFVESRIFLFGIWEPNLTAFLTDRLRAGDVFLDIGANVGYFSLLASKLVGPSGLAVAVEASPSNYSRLVENLEANRCANVRAFNLAASGSEGTVSVFKGPGSNAGVGSILASSGLPFEAIVRSVAACDLLSRDEARRCQVIKIDVECAEWPILENLLNELDRFSDTTEIVVEVEPGVVADVFGSFDCFMQRCRSIGFAVCFLENDYSYRAYRAEAPIVRPKLLERTPDNRTDLVLSRELNIASS